MAENDSSSNKSGKSSPNIDWDELNRQSENRRIERDMDRHAMANARADGAWAQGVRDSAGQGKKYADGSLANPGEWEKQGFHDTSATNAPG
jgi:hypothetical protein